MTEYLPLSGHKKKTNLVLREIMGTYPGSFSSGSEKSYFDAVLKVFGTIAHSHGRLLPASYARRTEFENMRHTWAAHHPSERVLERPSTSSRPKGRILRNFSEQEYKQAPPSDSRPSMRSALKL
ncbi:hypothetical protein EVAR_64920_1 [Eumeta japonica]|uniref:Uncharacterized protein n=1 Tax=Eumeta variegata TaxID=151549 RepID=A0A4C1ZPD4_EUMVA|nr:hypothetical protein EVAR_64920_1 [Eumeta japonica]